MEPWQHESTSFLLWKNPGGRKQITPWGQIQLCLRPAPVRFWCFNLSKSGNSSGSSSVLDPGSGDSVGASPTDILEMTHPNSPMTLPCCSLPALVEPKCQTLSLPALISKFPHPTVLLEIPCAPSFQHLGPPSLPCWLCASCG